MRNRTRFFGAALTACSILTAGCDYTPQQRVQAAQPAEDSYKDFGNYQVHYNAVRTDALTPQVARSYGIRRSTHRVMLNVTVLHKPSANAPPQPVEAAVKVDAYNLNGQLKNMTVRRVAEGKAIYYIGEVSIAGAEILVFDITATPAGTQTPLRVQFKREFHST